MSKKTKLSTNNYKGVRDFYPKDLQILKYIFSIMREVMESFGYEEYDASLLEYTEIYKAKSGQEIADEQTYTFKDKSNRTVSIRPEMTPTAARMIAKKVRELHFPVRWYSIPNLFRYENPQKGRLREHYQLNADIFGGNTEDADMEMIMLIHNVMTKFGAKTTDFVIYINDRRILCLLYELFNIDIESRDSISRFLDKRNKIAKKEFEDSMKEYMDEETLNEFLDSISSPIKILKVLKKDNPIIRHIIDIIEKLNRNNITNIFFEPTLVRGFDYYTGLVFEVFDTNPENPKAVFGGGRYDSLVSLFSDRDIPAIGFGLGDVRLIDFLNNRSLLPEYKPETEIMICRNENCSYSNATLFAEKFRNKGIPTVIDISGKKIKDQISRASKKKIPFIIIMEKNKKISEKIKIKHLDSEVEKEIEIEKAFKWIKEINS